MLEYYYVDTNCIELRRDYIKVWISEFRWIIVDINEYINGDND